MVQKNIKFEFPNKLEKIFDFLNKKGSVPIVVGGFVRDTLLAKKSKDIDVEVYNVSSYEQLLTYLEPFGKTHIVGKSFGVCKLDIKGYSIDFSLPRKENKTAKGHKGFNIIIDTKLDFSQASKRRDFTINAIGYNPITKHLLDCYGGIEDLNKKILRMIDPQTFIEDPLRFFRALGFVARFELRVDNELFELLSKMNHSNTLLELPKERIFAELEKLFLRSKKPSLALKLLYDLKEKNFFSPITSLSYESFKNYAKIFDNIEIKDISYYMALLALYIDITQFSNDKKLLERVTLLLKHHKEVYHFCKEDASDFELKYFATKVQWRFIFPFVKALYSECDFSKLERRVEELGVYDSAIPPKITGKDLIAKGLKPSKEFKTILHDLYIKQLKN